MNARRLLRFTLIAIAATLALVPGASATTDGGPQAYIVGPVDGAYFAQGQDVLFAFYCASDVSFVVSCSGSQPLGSPIDTANAGPHTLSVTATDFEGRQTTTTATYTVIDITKPHVVFRTPVSGGTYEAGSYVPVDYGCVDDPGGLGIQACEGDIWLGAPLDTHHLGTLTFGVYAVDWANNINRETVTYNVVDRTPPAITISAPADGGVYTLGEQLLVGFECNDGQFGSGTIGCKADPVGSQVDTSSLGSKSFTVTAYDRAGNVGRLTNTYSVVYDFTGFASPAAPYPTASPVKSGESIPLKFSLHGGQGMDVLAAGSPSWADCDSGDATPATGALSYNAPNDRYTYSVTTAKAWSGTCRDLVLTLRDGTVHRARFSFTK